MQFLTPKRQCWSTKWTEYLCETMIRNDYKKDGYRQQNVRQRQKLISIIDYDVCVTFY